MKWRRGKGARKRREWFSGAGCAAVGGVLFLLGVAAYLALITLLTNEQREEIAELKERIREAGQPLTLEELNAYYPAVPDEENAALVYHEASVLLDEIDPNGATVDALLRSLELSSGNDASLPELQQEIGAFLERCGEVFAHLERAATMPKARYPIEFSTTWSAIPAHFHYLERCARLEKLAALHGLLDGRQWEASECLKRMHHMAKSLEREPFMTSQIVRTSILIEHVESVEMGLKLAYLYPETLADIETLYVDTSDPEPLVRALAGERCLWLAEPRIPKAVEEVSVVGRVLNYLDPAGQSTFRQARLLSYQEAILKTYERLIRLAKEPWEERLTYTQDLRDNGTGWRRSVEFDGHPLYVALHGTDRMALETLFARTTLLTVALERYRETYDAVPQTLDELVPEFIDAIPVDPFDGQALRYVVSDQDYAIYSVAFDRVDDGGAPLEPVGEMDSVGDWVFTVQQ